VTDGVQVGEHLVEVVRRPTVVERPPVLVGGEQGPHRPRVRRDRDAHAAQVDDPHQVDRAIHRHVRVTHHDQSDALSSRRRDTSGAQLLVGLLGEEPRAVVGAGCSVREQHPGAIG
jgi:hypothetical protein